MIASVAVYALVLGLMLGALGRLLERGARAGRLPTRFIWMAIMASMLVVPAVGTLRSNEASATKVPGVVVPVTASSMLSASGLSVDPPEDTSLPRTASARLESLWRQALSTSERMARGHEHLLLGVWAAMSAFLLGMTLHAMSEARRMRLGLEVHTVHGTSVLVSEYMGPAAVGVRAAAIVVPRWVMSLDDSLRSLVIRHEQEHLATRDPALLTTALFLMVLMPWNPALWWTWYRLRLAIEVDCDNRVLRHAATPKLYAQLLLLVSHHRSTVSRGERALMSLAAPLSPQASHLKHRIDAMTKRPTKYRLSTIAVMAGGAVGASLLIAAVPAPNRSVLKGLPSAPPPSADVTVKVTRVGTKNVDIDGRGQMVGEILIYGSGTVKVGFGTSEPRVLSDTLRLKNFPAFTADVTQGDVHVELRGNGEIELSATVTGGPAVEVSASGRHLVLLKGGSGIRTAGGKS